MDSATKKILEESEAIKAAGAVLALCRDENDDRSKIFTDWVRYVRGVGVEDGANLPPHEFTYLVPNGEVRILPWGNVARHIEDDSAFRFGVCGEKIFVTTGNFSSLQSGDLLYIGPALLVVTGVGKICERNCEFSEGKDDPCHISKSWIFANVVRGGQVCVDDPFIATCRA